MLHLLRVFSFFLFVFLFTAASAELRQADMKLQAPPTQAAALLQQVDILSLYFSSTHIAYAPHLLQEKLIEIEATVLDPSLLLDQKKLENILMRQIQVFLRELKIRLSLYAPMVAKHFDENTDIRFVINQGVHRKPLGSWREGKLSLYGQPFPVETVASAPPQKETVFQFNEARVVQDEGKLELWRSCPAYRGK